MRGRAHRYRARRRRRGAVARRAGARLVPYHGGLSRRHRYHPVPRLGVPVGLGARWGWRTGAPGHQRAVGARASERRVDRLVAAARRHRRALPDCGNRRAARLQSLRVHRPHRAAVPPAAGTHRVDRHDQLHAGGDARPAARGGDSSDRAGHARRDGTPAAVVGLERAAGPRHAGTRAPRGRPRLRHRHRAAPTCARGGTLRGLAAGGGAVCGRPDGVCHARGNRGRRHGHGALAARRESGGQDLPDCRRPGRRYRSHRHHRQPYPGACRPSRDLQLVLSDRDSRGRVGPLERSSTAPAFACHRCVGERGRRGTTAAGHAAARCVVSSVRLTSGPRSVTLRVPLPARLPYQITERERSLTVRLYGGASDINWMQYGEGGGAAAGTDPLVTRMSYAQPAADEVTITLELARRVWGYRARFDGRDLLLEVRRPPVLDREHPLRGRTVVLDPGHPPLGARGPTGLWEPVATLAVAFKAKTLLERAGAIVFLSRTDSTPIELFPRTHFAELRDADVLVSIHANALPDGVNPFINSGTSVYYFQPRSTRLARELDRALVTEFRVRDLGIGRGDYALVRPTWMPAALTEGLFIMLPDQEAVLGSEDGQWRYARGVVSGIENFLRERAREP